MDVPQLGQAAISSPEVCEKVETVRPQAGQQDDSIVRNSYHEAGRSTYFETSGPRGEGEAVGGAG